MIRLEGGIEPDAYWKEVLETGDDRLAESGFEDWVVTLRPPVPSVGPDEPELTINLTADAKTLEIVVREPPELPPQSFVQTCIVDVINQAIGGESRDDLEDVLRDEGGEA